MTLGRNCRESYFWTKQKKRPQALGDDLPAVLYLDVFYQMFVDKNRLISPFYEALDVHVTRPSSLIIQAYQYTC